MTRSHASFGWRAVLAVTLLLGGCEETVEIRGECRIETGPTVLGEGVDAMPGLIAGEPYVFVATHSVERREGLDADVVTWDAHFWSWDLREHLSERRLGTGRQSVPPRWASADGALHALVPADPSSPVEPRPPEDTLHWWTIPAPDGADATHESLFLATVRTDCCGRPFGPGDAWLSTRGASIDTVVDASGRPTVLFPAVTIDCGEAVTNFKRVHWAGTSDFAARPLLWAEESCDPFDDDLRVAFVTPVASERGFGALLKSRAGKTRYVALEETDAGLTAPSPPRVVGGEPSSTYGPFSGDHWQPRAAAVGERILFTDRAQDSSCQYLRTMRADGTDAERTPWQLPCADGRWTTSSAELVEVGDDLAAIVWNEAEVVGDSVSRYRQRIRMTLLTPEGRRASAIVEVASTDRSAELPPSWEVRAASDGDGRIALTFSGSTTEGTGLHAATLSCTRREGE